MMRRIAWVLLAFTVLGCGEDPPPAPPRPDGGSRDAGVDGGTVDSGGVDGSTGVDAGPGGFDAGPYDAGPLTFPEDPCDIVTPPGCGAGCETGFACVPGVCGGMECVIGRACFTMNPECEGIPGDPGGGGPPDGAVFPDAGVIMDSGPEECENTCGGSIRCLLADDGNTYCESSTGTCMNSSECPLGFLCESNSCVDRRVPCGIVFDGCPRGYVCSNALRRGPAFCVLAQAACESSSECEMGASCIDVDGDGDSECQFAGVCQTNSQCTTPGTVCGIHPQTMGTVCVGDGPCSTDAECGDGYRCLDLAGTGSQRCERPGTCSANTDCPPEQVCASPRDIDAVQCIGRGVGG